MVRATGVVVVAVLLAAAPGVSIADDELSGEVRAAIESAPRPRSP